MMPAPTFTVLSLALALALAGRPAGADISEPAGSGASAGTVDTSRWNCALCPYRYGWTGEIDIGAGWVGEASNKFGDYRGLEDDGGFPALDGNAHYRGRDGGFFDLHAYDLGTDARRLDARGGVRGRYSLAFAYSEIPMYRGFGTATPYRGVGGSLLTLPAGWQAAPVTSEMTGLPAALQPIDLQATRKRIDAGLKWKLGRRWSYEVQYQHQSKDGTRPFGAGVFTINSSHLPAPVDFSTDRVEMGLNFKGDRSHWRVGLSGSSFDNAKESVTWQNPFTPAGGTDTRRAALEPDNSAWHVDLAGAWAPNSRLRLSASAAIGRLEQDDPLLPYSINPDFSQLPLPRLRAGTEVDVGTVDLSGRLSARLSRRFDLTARVQRDERDNHTPVDVWTPVITDFIERGLRPNRPYSFTRDRASLALRFRPGTKLRLEAGAEWEDYERSLQSVRQTDEDRWFAEASLSPGPKIDLRARLDHSERDGQPYLQVEDFSLAEHPLMRKFNLADRDRSRLRLDLDFFPGAELTVNLAYRRDQDEYDESVIGLRESEERSLSLDLSWNPGDKLTAYAFISSDDFDSLQAGTQTAIADPWLATTDDAFLTVGLGMTLELGPRASLGIDLVSADADGDIRTDSGAGEPPFPSLETELRNARLWFEYRPSDHWGLRLYLEHEEYDSSDWALDGVGPADIPAVLNFGAESPDYSVTVLRAQASYRF